MSSSRSTATVRYPTVYDVIFEILSRHISWELHGPVPLPSEPTDALPGSAEKIRVMQHRARLRQRLFHPSDAAGCVPMATGPNHHLLPVDRKEAA